MGEDQSTPIYQKWIPAGRAVMQLLGSPGRINKKEKLHERKSEAAHSLSVLGQTLEK